MSVCRETVEWKSDENRAFDDEEYCTQEVQEEVSIMTSVKPCALKV